MLSVSTHDLIAAALFVGGCGLLFVIRYVGSRVTNQPTTKERNTDE